MNKYLITLVTLSLIMIPTLCESQVYRCASELGIKGLCYKLVRKGSDNTVYVDGCPEGEYCPTSSEESYCTKIPIKKDEGEKCRRNLECKSNICEAGKCATLLDGESCEKHFECGKGSACKKNVCTPLANEGENCENDYECGFNLACGNGKCQKMFSLEAGAKSDNWQLCKSGHATQLIGTESMCVDKKQETTTCEKNYEKSCIFTLTGGYDKATYNEWCLPNWDYKPFCEDGSNTSLWREFLELYNFKVNQIDPTTIKVTDLRPIFWDPLLLTEKVTAHLYARTKGAPKCVYDYQKMNYIHDNLKYFLS